MGRGGKQLLRRANLHHLAEIHHQNAVRQPAHHVQIVADKHIGQRQRPLQFLQQLQYLGFHRFIQRRDGLVEDHQPGLHRQRAGDIHALALAAGERVRITVGKTFRFKADVRQQIAGVFAGLFGADAVYPLAERDALFHGHTRVERRVAILEDHLHLAAIRFHRQAR